MQVLHVCSEMFPLLKRADWRMFLVHYRRRKLPEGWIPACCCPLFRISGVVFPMQRLLPVARPSRDVSPCCLDITMAQGFT